MRIIEKSENSIHLEINSAKNFTARQLILLVIFCLFVGIYMLITSINENSKTYIQCSSSTKNCIIDEYKYLSKPKHMIIPIKNIGYAKVVNISCSKGICSYYLYLSHKDGFLTLFYDHREKSYLDQIAKGINAISEQKIAQLNISPNNNDYFLTINFFGGLFMMILGIFVLVSSSINEEILLNKEAKSLSRKRILLFGTKTVEIDISKVTTFKFIDKTKYIKEINYMNKNSIEKSLSYRFFRSDDVKSTCELLNTFLFDGN